MREVIRKEMRGAMGEDMRDVIGNDRRGALWVVRREGQKGHLIRGPAFLYSRMRRGALAGSGTWVEGGRQEEGGRGEEE